MYDSCLLVGLAAFFIIKTDINLQVFHFAYRPLHNLVACDFLHYIAIAAANIFLLRALLLSAFLRHLSAVFRSRCWLGRIIALIDPH
ncbi:hypothetical protein D3C78_1566480 [compost metagenome]